MPGTYTIETDIETLEEEGYIFYKKLSSEMTVKEGTQDWQYDFR